MEFVSTFQDWSFQWQFISPDRFVNAALALLLAAIVGGLTGPRGSSALPLFWTGINKTFGVLAGRLDKKIRSEGSRIFRGFFLTIIMVVFIGALGIWIREMLPYVPQARLIEVLLLSFCLSCGALWTHVLAIIKTVHGTLKKPGTYLILSRTSRFDLSSRDDFTIARTGAEVLARLFDKACVAPLLWYVLAGLPGAFIYAALGAYVWHSGYDGTQSGVAKVAGALEKLLGFIPSLFASFFIAATSFLVPGSQPVMTMQAFSTRNQHPYDQGGAPLSMLAFGQNIVLGGPATHIDGTYMKRPWSGPKGATAQVNVDYLKRVLYMIILAHVYFLAALIGGSLWAQLVV